MELVNEANNWRFSLLPAKMVPLWMVKLPLFPKIFSFLTNALERFRGQTIKDVVEGLTNDEDLKEVLAFHWNVLAVAPAELPFTVHGVFQRSVGRRPTETKCYKKPIPVTSQFYLLH